MPQVLLNQHRIHYEIRGEAHRPKLLCLHGFMGCGDDFDAIVDALLPEFCCLTLDLPGHGQTEVLDLVGYGMEAIATALVALMSLLNFTPCHLMGYSMGGRLALYLACRFPQLFSSLVLESASPGLATEAERIQRCRQDHALATELESEDWPSFLSRWYEQPLFATLKSNPCFDELFQRRLQNHPHPLAQALRGLSTGIQPSLWDELSALNIPITLIVGAMDRKFVQVNQHMAAQLPSAQIQIISGCSHAVHRENATAFITVLKTHLKKAFV
jgi:2-succinyl-6-hydroxy-2,4-cyclohexadiene-1-carboxylate synthase